MKPTTLQATASIALYTLLALGSANLQATGAPPANSLAHCNWGDLGCTNPPPQAKLQCDPSLSSGGECWTNCKTEDDITICDILSLDTFMPEAPRGGPTHMRSGK